MNSFRVACIACGSVLLVNLLVYGLAIAGKKLLTPLSKYLKPVLNVILIVAARVIVYPIMTLFYVLNRKHRPPLGYGYIELPMDTVIAKFPDSCSCSFSLTYEAGKELRKNKERAESFFLENRNTLVEFQDELAELLAKQDPCLLDFEGYWYEDYPPKEPDREKSFALDIEQQKRYLEGCTEIRKSGHKCVSAQQVIREFENWYENSEKISNLQGDIIAVRGISKETMNTLRNVSAISINGQSVYELIIPDAEEDALRKMNSEKLCRFQDINACKFKIANEFFGETCSFIPSSKNGYTKADMLQKVKELAESKGYKFKVIE